MKSVVHRVAFLEVGQKNGRYLGNENRRAGYKSLTNFLSSATVTCTLDLQNTPFL
jgi:hypothetical protein